MATRSPDPLEASSKPPRGSNASVCVRFLWRYQVNSQTWIMGLAAEAVGTSAARREVTIQSDWDRPAAVHPLASCSTTLSAYCMNRMIYFLQW